MSADNVTTWRELADQLTPLQCAQAEKLERDALAGPADIAELLLEVAREHAHKNLNGQLMFGHLPIPTDANRLWHWERADEGWRREFTGTERDRQGFAVTICGVQQADGSVSRWANVYSIDPAPDCRVDDLRAMASLLLAAADELDAAECAGATSDGTPTHSASMCQRDDSEIQR